MSSLAFHGAAGTVTGSCTWVEARGVAFLVDCGLFQGNKTTRALNQAEFPFDPKALKFMALTHAHTDHAGLIPKLVAQGFDGPIYATAPTKDLLEFMMRDSARIQESDTERRNRRLRREGKPAQPPLFVMEDAEAALNMIEPVEMEDWFTPADGIELRYWNAGHILGSASIEAKYAETDTERTMRLLFSGDLGPDEKTFHAEPGGEKGFDYIICESTYGDRDRAEYTLEARRAALKKELVEGLARGGNVVVPCFAVERSQEILHDIDVLLAEGALGDAVVYLDSPLAGKVTEVFIKHAHTLEDIEVAPEKLFKDRRFKITQSVDESRAINSVTKGAIIISASGMADAGRIQHHLKQNLWRDNATVLFVGYQAPGTTGAHIRSGAKDVLIHGKPIKIKATVRSIGNFSAHADQGELIDWILERGPIAGGLFLNHGDDDAREELKRLLAERGIAAEKIHIPQLDERFDLSAGTPQSKGRDAVRVEKGALIRDWYNDYAAFTLDLRNRLEAAETAAERQATLARLTTALDG